MTALLDQAVEAARRLPAATQDEIAAAMLRFMDREDGPEEVDPNHLAGVLEGLSQARERRFATDEQVEAAFARFER